MSHVFAETQLMAAAAGDLAAIRSTLGATNKAIAAPTAGVIPAGGDQVSAVIAAMFGVHAQSYQVMGAQAAEFHDKFVQALRTGAGAYASTEASNTKPMQQALGAAPTPGGSMGGAGAAGPAAHPGNGAPAAAGGSHGDGGGGAMPSSNGGGGAGPGGGDVSGGGPAAISVAGGANGLSAGDGGGSHVGASAGWTGAVADPGGSGSGSPSGAGGAVGAAGVPNTGWWAGGPGSPGAAGLSHGHTVGASGDSGAIAGMGVPTAPAPPPAAAAPAAAEPDLALAARAQPVQAAIPALAGHPDNLARPGNVLDTDRDKLPQLIPVPLPRLRGLRKKLQGLRNRDEDESGPLTESGDDRSSRPPSREELLYALGVRVPGHGA
jgi:hypothetical protein